MALYSRPDYYVKTFTARNCSRNRKPRAFPELKQNACLLRPRPCLPKSLISIWARWPVGFGASVRAAPFSAFRSHQPVLPLQPTPTGAIEKVRFALLGPLRTNTHPCAARNCPAGTRRRVPARYSSAARWKRRQAPRDAPKRCARHGFAPERCFTPAVSLISDMTASLLCN